MLFVQSRVVANGRQDVCIWRQLTGFRSMPSVYRKSSSLFDKSGRCTEKALHFPEKVLGVQQKFFTFPKKQSVFTQNPSLYTKRCTLHRNYLSLSTGGFVQPQIAVISGIRSGGVFSLAPGDFVIGRSEAAD